MMNESIVAKYKKVYELPELEYEEKVSSEFFELCKRKYYFVIVSIYNLKNEILLIRDFNKAIGWELPGGYVNDHESIEEAINKITLNEAGLNIDELSPVAIIKNTFRSGDKKIVHSGVAFMALSRGSVKTYPKNFQAHFTSSTPEKIAYQNDKVLSIVRKQLSNKAHHPPFEEIDSVKNFSLLYLLHRYVIKRIGNFSSRKIKRVIFDLIEGKPKSILDASCGESSIINELYEKYKPDICIGNDISWKAITLIKNKNSLVFFTNHNVLNLPYRIKFDLVIFKNTFHHIEKEHQEEVLSNLKKMAKQLIIIDVDDPQNSTFRSKLWNSYYVYLLGDQGDSFLTFNEFKKILNSENIAGYRIKTDVIDTIKGNYFYASVKDQ
ncbi:MAG: methyltransferase domain-containing protein [bacterium]|nr:methyltransferase domain-containing protein [bacterium]